MIASAMVYARYTNHLQFTVVGPNNEPDLPGVGVGIADGTEYTLPLHKLAEQFDAHGLTHLRFVGVDDCIGDGLCALYESFAVYGGRSEQRPGPSRGRSGDRGRNGVYAATAQAGGAV